MTENTDMATLLLKDANVELMKKLALAENSVKATAKKLLDVRKAYEELSADLDNAEKEIEKLKPYERDFRKMENAFNGISKEHDTLLDSIKNMNYSLIDMKAEKESLEKENKVLNTRLNEAHKTNSILLENNDSLLKQMGGVEQLLVEKSNQLAQIKSDSPEVKDYLAMLKTDPEFFDRTVVHNHNLRDQTGKLIQEVAKLTQELDSLKLASVPRGFKAPKPETSEPGEWKPVSKNPNTEEQLKNAEHKIERLENLLKGINATSPLRSPPPVVKMDGESTEPPDDEEFNRVYNKSIRLEKEKENLKDVIEACGEVISHMSKHIY